MFRSLFAVVALVALLQASPVLAKRKPPPVVAPVVSGTVRYAVAHEKTVVDGRPVGLRAFVEKTNADAKVVWRTQVYQIDFDRNLETDVQEVYLASLTLGGVGVIAVNESGRRFVLDPINGRLRD